MIEIKDPDCSYREYPGPVLLLAGPGTGKTYQLALRVKYLVEELSAQRDEIAVITFTNEAARNMREKLSEEEERTFLPTESQPQIISTMHSLGNSIVGSKPTAFGLREDYEVLHEDSPRRVLLQDGTTLAGLDRDNWQLTDKCRRDGNCKEDPSQERCKICAEYKEILRKCSLVDYDDLIFLACEALGADKSLREEWKGRTKHLLVDEYQDINEAQCQLIQLLTEGQVEGLFAVGDDDQSIYSFRGGTPKYIRKFGKYFGGKSKIGRLTKSWRCPEHILKGARTMVTSFYKDSVPKPEPTFVEGAEPGAKIHFYDVPSDKYEAFMIARMASQAARSASVLIVIPNRNYLPLIKGEFADRGVNYTWKVKLDEQGLVRLTALSDWLEKPKSNHRLRYLIDLIVNNYDELTHKVETEDGRITAKRQAASVMIAELWGQVSEKTSLHEVICSKAKRTQGGNYFAALKNCLDEVTKLLREKGNSRQGLVPFFEKCGLIVAPGKTPNRIIAELTEWKNELLGTRKATFHRPVSIYNMPSCKGLQGDVVFVVGLSKGIFPNPEHDVEEESRLFYVTMTRAKKELHLFSARTRSGGTTYKQPSYGLARSPFIDAIPKEHIDVEERYPKKARPRTRPRKKRA